MNTLVIDAANSKRDCCRIADRKKEIFSQTQNRLEKAQVILPMIEKLLKKIKLRQKILIQSEVNAGPGSFTGLRIGISIANTLGMILKIG